MHRLSAVARRLAPPIVCARSCHAAGGRREFVSVNSAFVCFRLPTLTLSKVEARTSSKNS